MEKFIPYEKLSKKEKRKIDKARRQTWNSLNPVTRKPMSSKAYNRSKTRDWKRDYHEPTSGLVIIWKLETNVLSSSSVSVSSKSSAKADALN